MIQRAHNHIMETRDVVVRFREHIRGRVLDFGSGEAKYREIVEPKADAYTTFDGKMNTGVDIVGNVMAPELPDASFDTILCTQVLEHVPEPGAVTKHIARMLAPGGTAIITAPFMAPFHADPDDYFRYSASGLRAMAAASGLEPISQGRIGGTFLVGAEALRFLIADPYGAKRPSLFRRRVVRLTHRIAAWLDARFDSTSMFTGSYVIARKSE